MVWGAVFNWKQNSTIVYKYLKNVFHYVAFAKLVYFPARRGVFVVVIEIVGIVTDRMNAVL